jgi:hypothetical protein
MSKKKEIVTVVPKKKSKGKTVVKVIVAIAAIQGILKMVEFYKNKKDKKQPEATGTKKYTLWMGGKQVRLDEEELRSIEIKAVMSGIDIDLTKTMIHQDMFITGKAVMSGVCIRVPENINVKMNCKTILGACANSVPKYFDETLPTIFVEVDGIMSGIAVKIGNTDEIENDEVENFENFENDSDKEDSDEAILNEATAE